MIEKQENDQNEACSLIHTDTKENEMLKKMWRNKAFSSAAHTVHNGLNALCQWA